ncbi:hypothetical protein ACIGO6_38650 [Streptomyces sp. NPDC053750]|uniref:hypothetical protein n=1 Tax=Streptomyces sp. NPDC053750 TaxID=3365714 RepID=UPI0037CE3BB2
MFLNTLVFVARSSGARIAEGERQGWRGEAEGLKVSLAGAENALKQLDAQVSRAQRAVHLGMPG